MELNQAISDKKIELGGGNSIKDVVKFYLEWEVTVFFVNCL